MTFSFLWLSGEVTGEERHGSMSFKCAHVADCQLITPLSHTHSVLLILSSGFNEFFFRNVLNCEPKILCFQLHLPICYHLFSYFFNQVIGVVSREYIPKGTRFGPLVGESYTAENVPKDANRKYFWRVSCFVSESSNTVGVDKKKNTWSLPVPLTDFLCDIMG